MQVEIRHIRVYMYFLEYIMFHFLIFLVAIVPFEPRFFCSLRPVLPQGAAVPSWDGALTLNLVPDSVMAS